MTAIVAGVVHTMLQAGRRDLARPSHQHVTRRSVVQPPTHSRRLVIVAVQPSYPHEPLERAIQVINRLITVGERAGWGSGGGGSGGDSPERKPLPERWVQFGAAAASRIDVHTAAASTTGTAVAAAAGGGGADAEQHSPAGEVGSSSGVGAGAGGAGSAVPGRTLRDFLALDPTEYSLLDPKWIERLEGGEFKLRVPLGEVLGIDLTPQLHVAAQVDRRRGQVSLLGSQAALGHPELDSAFTLHLEAVLSQHGGPEGSPRGSSRGSEAEEGEFEDEDDWEDAKGAEGRGKSSGGGGRRLLPRLRRPSHLPGRPVQRLRNLVARARGASPSSAAAAAAAATAAAPASPTAAAALPAEAGTLANGAVPLQEWPANGLSEGLANSSSSFDSSSSGVSAGAWAGNSLGSTDWEGLAAEAYMDESWPLEGHPKQQRQQQQQQGQGLLEDQWRVSGGQGDRNAGGTSGFSLGSSGSSDENLYGISPWPVERTQAAQQQAVRERSGSPLDAVPAAAAAVVAATQQQRQEKQQQQEEEEQRRQQQSQQQQQQQQQDGLLVQASSGVAAAQLGCDVLVRVSLRVPAPIRVVPNALLGYAGSLILKAVMNAALPNFLELLAADYRHWAAGGARDTNAVVGDLFAEPHAAQKQ